MRFHNVLDELLGNKTKVRILRTFFTYPEKEFSESELQRIGGIPQASVHRNVKSLHENGLLKRKRIGKANLYSLNKEHVMHPTIMTLFAEERDLIKMLKKFIGEKISGLPEIKLAVLFGSLIKGRERPDSDVDIFIVSEGDTLKTEEDLECLISIVKARFGNPVSLLIKHKRELKELKTRSIYSEIKSGEVILRQEGFEW